MKKRLEIGAKVRITENLWGEVVFVGPEYVKLQWKRTRGKGTVVREAVRFFPKEEIYISDDADAAVGIGYRLQYFIQDGRGEALDVNRSNSSAKTQKLWTPRNG